MPTASSRDDKSPNLILRLTLAAVAALVIILWLGVVGPYCMSSRNDTLVIAWPVATILGVLAGAIYAIHWVSTNTERKDSNHE